MSYSRAETGVSTKSRLMWVSTVNLCRDNKVDFLTKKRVGQNKFSRDFIITKILGKVSKTLPVCSWYC